MEQKLKVGFIGLGDQGAPIARRIIDAGYDTTLWARRPATLEAFADTPAHAAPSLVQLGAACDVVGVCVYDDPDVEQVVGGEGGLLSSMRADGIILIHATAHPDLCKRLADEGKRRNVIVLDAPVSGGHARAVAGQMAVMIGGSKPAYEKVLPILKTFATGIEWLGPVGSGQICKLVNNAITTVNTAIAMAYLKTGEKLGLDRPALSRVLAAGSAQSFALEHLANASIENLRFAEPRLRKDAELVLGMLKAQGVGNEPAADLTRRGFEAFADFVLHG